MSRTFLIHGYGGTPTQGWHPWLKAELEARGHQVSAPQMPDTQHPRVDAWTRALADTVGEPRADDMFVGHSLGCIAIIRYLLTLKPGRTVGRCVFVAGFYEELGPEYEELRSFLDDPIDWDAVKGACPSFAVIHSTDDDAVPVWCAENLAMKLCVPIEMHHGYGHFSGSDGVTEAPMVLEKLV